METKFDRALVELLERDQRVEWSKDRIPMRAKIEDVKNGLIDASSDNSAQTLVQLDDGPKNGFSETYRLGAYPFALTFSSQEQDDAERLRLRIAVLELQVSELLVDNDNLKKIVRQRDEEIAVLKKDRAS